MHYTSNRHVRKPKEVGPGLVTLREFKTIRVKPDPGTHLRIKPRAPGSKNL
ncbi:hypothetical protein ACFLU6_14880 [Acidobacteriota bacterium]